MLQKRVRESGMDIYLIRHGECCENKETYYDTMMRTMNPPLTGRGIQQAQFLAKRLADMPFDLLYASDLRRAVETMEIVNGQLQAKVVVTESFREIDMGEVLTKSWDAFPELHRRWRLHQEDLRYPSGENGQDVWERCRPVMEEILQSDCRRVAIFCHGGTIRAIVCGMMGIPQEKRFFLGQPLHNCSVTVMRKNRDGVYLHSLNDCCQLDD